MHEACSILSVRVISLIAMIVEVDSGVPRVVGGVQAQLIGKERT